ncbi:MAG TPA: hypothetical protein VF598_08660 [Hymenobacter sp.]|jgi:hypothetical protein
MANKRPKVPKDLRPALTALQQEIKAFIARTPALAGMRLTGMTLQHPTKTKAAATADSPTSIITATNTSAENVGPIERGPRPKWTYICYDGNNTPYSRYGYGDCP